MAKLGRPIAWPAPNTQLSNRLQEILPHESFAKLSEKYFFGVARETVAKYLSGENEPPPSALVQIAEKLSCDLEWLLTGKTSIKTKRAPAKSTGADEEKYKQVIKFLEVRTLLDGALNKLNEDALAGRLDLHSARSAVAEALVAVQRRGRTPATADKTARNSADNNGTNSA